MVGWPRRWNSRHLLRITNYQSRITSAFRAQTGSSGRIRTCASRFNRAADYCYPTLEGRDGEMGYWVNGLMDESSVILHTTPTPQHPITRSVIHGATRTCTSISPFKRRVSGLLSYRPEMVRSEGVAPPTALCKRAVILFHQPRGRL